LDQLVKCGGLDVRIAPGGDGVGALVVGEEEENVGTAIRSCGGATGEAGNQEKELNCKAGEAEATAAI